MLHDCSKIAAKLNEQASQKRFCWSYGAAISSVLTVDERSGFWSVGNGEYCSPVLFCPYCGVELAKVETGVIK